MPRVHTWIMITVVPLLLLGFFVAGWIPDPIVGSPQWHFYIVTITAILLALVAWFMALAAMQVRDLRVTFLALAFLGTAGIFLAHAITTPQALIPHTNSWVGFSARFCLVVASVFLALSTNSWSRKIESRLIGYQRRAFIIAALLLVGYNLVAFTSSMMPPAPAGPQFSFLANSQLHSVLTSLTLMSLAFTGWRYLQRYRARRSPLVAGLLAATIFFAQTQIVIVSTVVWHASWWFYHFLLFAAFVAAGSDWPMSMRAAAASPT